MGFCVLTVMFKFVCIGLLCLVCCGARSSVRLEHRTFNPGVTGSIPVGPAFFAFVRLCLEFGGCACFVCLVFGLVSCFWASRRCWLRLVLS